MQYQNENVGGSYTFRCREHYGFSIDAHLHEYSELLYCRKGMGEATVNGRPLRIPEKHFLWIPPNYVHEYACPDAEMVCAVFSNDFVPLFAKTVGERQLICTPVAAADMTEVLDSFYLLWGKSLVLIGGYLHLLCAKVLENASFAAAGQTDTALCQKVISYISDHYPEPITLKEVAQRFGYNEKYLSSVLHTVTGIHFRKLLAFYRIDHAKHGLTHNPTMSISEVAFSSGFSALNTFNRVFKEHTGMTPQQYRKQRKI